MHGKIESLKGTYLHKKIELFINAMARPMETSKSSHAPVKELLRETPPAQEYSAVTVMQRIAWSQEAELWDHPLAQSFFSKRAARRKLGIYKVSRMALDGATLDTSTGGVEPLQ